MILEWEFVVKYVLINTIYLEKNRYQINNSSCLVDVFDNFICCILWLTVLYEQSHYFHGCVSVMINCCMSLFDLTM